MPLLADFLSPLYIRVFPLLLWIAVSTACYVFGLTRILAVATAATAYHLYQICRPKKVKEGDQYRAIVIGAGFSGLAAGIRLAEAGVQFLILEKSSGLGGTWKDNVYPEAASDMPAHLYSYSFFQNPWWSRRYCKRDEILLYLETVASHFEVRRRILFGRKVVSCEWDADSALWTVTTEQGDKHVANFVVVASGVLHVPRMPQVKGLDEFGGTVLHSAQWRSDVTSLSSKHVAVVGTGASAVQIVPAVAETATKLYVIQRSAAWTPAKHDCQYPTWAKWLFALFPPSMKLLRWFYFLRNELSYYVTYRLRTGPVAQRRANLVIERVHATVRDPVVANALTPDYEMGCKRITPTDNYLETFNKSHVRVVTSRLERFTPFGLKTSEEEIAVDVIILATGFDPVKSFHAFRVVGKCGKELGAEYALKQTAYYGTFCPQFPNLFFVLGPNTVLGHSSFVFVIECQVNYIVDCIRTLITSGKSSMEVKTMAAENFTAKITRLLRDRVWSTGCSSWYRNEKGLPWLLWPNDLIQFWWMRIRRCNLKDFNLK